MAKLGQILLRLRQNKGIVSLMEIAVRRATLADQDHIRALESVLKSRAEADFAELLFASVTEGGRSVILGFLDGRAAGYVVLNWAPDYGLFARLNIPELQDLNVLPEDRRHGLGARLVAACEKLARERGHSDIGLAVGLTQSYGAAQRLYVRLGFLPDGQGVTYNRQSVKPGDMRRVDDDLCLMMVKNLKA